MGPGWRAWVVIVLVAMSAVLVGAWVYVPDFREALDLVWGEARAWAARKLA